MNRAQAIEELTTMKIHTREVRRLRDKFIEYLAVSEHQDTPEPEGAGYLVDFLKYLVYSP